MVTPAARSFGLGKDVKEWGGRAPRVGGMDGHLDVLCAEYSNAYDGFDCLRAEHCNCGKERNFLMLLFDDSSEYDHLLMTLVNTIMFVGAV